MISERKQRRKLKGEKIKLYRKKPSIKRSWKVIKSSIRTSIWMMTLMKSLVQTMPSLLR